MQLESTSLCMQCNIDAKGKAIRLKLGILGILGGMAVAISFFVNQPNWEMMWIIPAGIISVERFLSSKVGQDGV